MILCTQPIETHVCYFKLKMGVGYMDTGRSHTAQGQECSQASEVERLGVHGLLSPCHLCLSQHPILHLPCRLQLSLCTQTLAEDCCFIGAKVYFYPHHSGDHTQQQWSLSVPVSNVKAS